MEMAFFVVHIILSIVEECMNDIMNDIVYGKGHNFLLWMTLWMAKKVTILWTTSSFAYQPDGLLVLFEIQSSGISHSLKKPSENIQPISQRFRQDSGLPKNPKNVIF